MISRHTLHLTTEEAEIFYQRLKTLVRETLEQSRIGRANPDARAYGLLISLYPSTRTGTVDSNDT
jgi:hypothetical protein